MNPKALSLQIETDINTGFTPLLIVATLGTTGTGSIDPILEIKNIASKYNCWLHADAAYGGAVIVNEEFRHLLSGIEFSDSITFDIHKWLSAPMATSLFITRHKNILGQTFRVTADYMPKEAKEIDVTDPFTHTIQWSRRFIGLKLYVAILFYGWEGMSDLVKAQIVLGNYLRDKLKQAGWEIYNHTMLPVICFGKKEFAKDNTLATTLCQKIIQTGQAWLSVYDTNGINTLRVCITNFATTRNDIDKLCALLDEKTPLFHP